MPDLDDLCFYPTDFFYGNHIGEGDDLFIIYHPNGNFESIHPGMYRHDITSYQIYR
jgi:hypothetical protein